MHTTHMIERDGKEYFLEWHTDLKDGERLDYIAITETCDRSDEETEDEPDYDCEHETYDFTEIHQGVKQ